jgi:hypothetical protein
MTKYDSISTAVMELRGSGLQVPACKAPEPLQGIAQ